MKNDKMLFALGEIDDKYVSEAKPTGRNSLLIKGLSLAACLIILVGAVIFTLPKGGHTVSEYEQNPEFLAAIKDYIVNVQANDFYFTDDEENDGMGGGGASGGSGSSNGSYVETTDNQVDGIIEGDLTKATEKYIFRLGGHSVYIYSINGKDSKLVSEYIIPYMGGERSYTFYDMFLSENGNTLTLFGKYDNVTDEGTYYLGKTVVISIDVSNVTCPKEIGRAVIKGAENTVRKIGDKFYLITNWAFSANRIDPDNPESFIPHIEYGGEKHICASDKIIFPEKLSSVSYKYVTVLNEGDLSLSDELSLMVSGNAYFTEGSIVFDSPYLEKTENDTAPNSCYTKIAVLSFRDGLDFKGYITLKGWTNNQYSYDEKDGALRIVTSLSDNAGYVIAYDSASLYVYDVDTLREIASVEEFAPRGEGVTAVRFEGDRLYVCTAEVIRFNDPVYFFDLSDYSNITYVDTGFIDGFSSSLIDFGEGYLLGVGREDSSTNKLEVYKREGDQVVSVDKYLFSGTAYTSYKSFLIDRENNLFGMSVSKYSTDGSNARNVYLVFKITDGKLSVLCEMGVSSDYARAFARGGDVYLTVNDSLYVYATELGYTVESHHAHTAGEWTVVTEPSCGEWGMLQSVCSCGRVRTKTNYSAAFTDHQLVRGICTSCGKDLGSVKKNADLIIYTSNGDGTCTVSGSKQRLYGDVVIPEKSPAGERVVKIGEAAFAYCGIQNITLPSSLSEIGNYAFYCSTLESINLGNVTVIGNKAFYACEKLTGVSFSEGLKSIGTNAFEYCVSLTELILPDSLSEIGDNAFNGCSKIESIKLPKGLTVINRGVFNMCMGIREIVIPDSVTLIGDYAFNYCQSLKSVVIPDGVTELGSRAFGSCKALMHVTLGSGVKAIGDDAFADCVALIDVVNRSKLDIQAGSKDYGMIGYYATSISKENSHIVHIDDYTFYISDEKKVLVAYNGSDTTLHLPEIQGGYEIGSRVFYGREDLTEVHFPDGVSAIGDEAFYRCTGISSITLPDSVKSIGYIAFLGCKFTSLDMGDGVVSIGKEAFRDCSLLKNLHLSKSLESIGEGAFKSCSKLTSLNLPKSVKKIGAEAFWMCTSITSVIIPDGARVIERDSFRNCTSLISMVIPESVLEIKNAFYVSNKLKTIYYRGSEEQWEEIKIDYNNGLFQKATIIYNYTE